MSLPASLQSKGIRRSFAPGAELTEYVLLRVRAAETPSGPRPALAVVLVIDTSGSMGGEPIRQVIASTQKIAEMLEAGDALGVVSFSAAAGTVSPLRGMSSDARGVTKREVGEVQAQGNTNMSGGIAHAALLFPVGEGRERRVMIVLSDGQPNVGASTPKALAEEVLRVRQRGVAVSTLGYGASHNDDVMIAVSDAGGGRYAFVPDAKLAAGSFARALGAQRDVVLEGVELLLTPSEGVEIRRVLGEARTSFGASGLKVTLPDLTAGDELNVVVELKLRAPMRTGAWVPLGAGLSGRAPVTREPFATEVPVRVELVEGGGNEFEAEAVVAVALALADEARTRARALADRRDFAGAAAVLREARQALLETPGYVKGSDGPLDDAVEALTDEITNMDRVPAAEEYQKLRKAARDYGEFAQAGTRATGGQAMQQSPSMLAYQKVMVGAVVPEAYLVVIAGGEIGVRTRHRLTGEDDIGRGVNAGIRVMNAGVSRMNSRVVFEGGGFWIIDTGSTGGTYVDGQRVERAPLVHGAQVRMGDVVLRFEVGAGG